MKLKYSFEAVDVGNETICVAVGRDANKLHGVLKMNHEGLEILRLLKEETTAERIVDVLSEKYDNDRDTLFEYVNKVVDILSNEGII